MKTELQLVITFKENNYSIRTICETCIENWSVVRHFDHDCQFLVFKAPHTLPAACFENHYFIIFERYTRTCKCKYDTILVA